MTLTAAKTKCKKEPYYANNWTIEESTKIFE